MLSDAFHRAALAIVCILPLCGVGLCCVFAQQPLPPIVVRDKPAEISLTTGGKRTYVGVEACAMCHELGRSSLADDVPPPIIEQREIARWKDDSHRLARIKIEPEHDQRAAEMQHRLGNRWDQKACAACHAPGERKYTSKSLPFAIDCESCHGPASDWLDDHWKEWTNYGGWSLEQKCSAGMVNVRHRADKARLCLSCHLGDAQQKRIVTHEMYAAGHPPLSGFVTPAFATAMPAHWQPMVDKPADFQKYHSQLNVHATNTHDVLLDGLVTLECYLNLLVESRDQSESSSPELAVYDCFACHQELRRENLQQNRESGIPGRPSLPQWPQTLARLVMKQSGQPLETWDGIQRILRALDERPFGRRDDLRAAAAAATDQVRAAITSLERQLSRSDLNAAGAEARDRKLAAQLLVAICDLATTNAHDFDSARQLYWAFDRVFYDFQKLNPQFPTTREVRAACDTLQKSLDAELGRPKHVANNDNATMRYFAARATFDPKKFADNFKKLSDYLHAGNGRVADVNKPTR